MTLHRLIVTPPRLTFIQPIYERGSGRSQLCAKLPDGRMSCTEIALEAKSLFSTMQSLDFFCTLPHDPAKTHINCQRIPQA
ncbi:hypothetical protein NDA13_001050 [Ustilago tritici]|nr:hypothetical protein NDA13_001050 [Ustilago tritici]